MSVLMVSLQRKILSIGWRVASQIGTESIKIQTGEFNQLDTQTFQRFLSLSLFIATQILNVQHCKKQETTFS